MKELTKTKLHQMGYRKGSGCYWKKQCNKVRPENKVVVKVQFWNYDPKYARFYDVVATEYGPTGNDMHSSERLRGIQQLKQWEKFAFCK